MNAIRLYGRYASISLRGQMEYRASFLMQTAGQFVVTGIEFLGIWALFSRFGQIRGWTLPEVAFFYGLISITWSIADAITRGFDVFGTTVKNGDFDRLLLEASLDHRATIRARADAETNGTACAGPRRAGGRAREPGRGVVKRTYRVARCWRWSAACVSSLD